MSNVIDLNRYAVKKYQEISAYLTNTKAVPPAKFEKLNKKLAHIMRLNAFCVNGSTTPIATFTNSRGTRPNSHLSYGVNPLGDFDKSWAHLVPPTTTPPTTI
jgi:hypothetical protein